MKLVGKYLLRVSKLSNTKKKVLTITGVFDTDFDLSQIDPKDEMWVSEIEIKSGLRFKANVRPTGAMSPEDFLEGEDQNPNCWEQKLKIEDSII